MADDAKKETKNPQSIKAGDEVRLVLAGGKHAAATVKKVGKGNLVDLEAEHNGETVTITSSPHDPDGRKPDSWHAVPAEAATK
jgi:hypothetical protein